MPTAARLKGSDECRCGVRCGGVHTLLLQESGRKASSARGAREGCCDGGVPVMRGSWIVLSVEGGRGRGLTAGRYCEGCGATVWMDEVQAGGGGTGKWIHSDMLALVHAHAARSVREKNRSGLLYKMAPLEPQRHSSVFVHAHECTYASTRAHTHTHTQTTKDSQTVR